MDDVAQLLDRAVATSLDTSHAPPVGRILQRARRRSIARTAASVTLVLAMTVGGVIGLASAGRASETTSDLAATSTAAHAGPAPFAR